MDLEFPGGVVHTAGFFAGERERTPTTLLDKSGITLMMPALVDLPERDIADCGDPIPGKDGARLARALRAWREQLMKSYFIGTGREHAMLTEAVRRHARVALGLAH